MLLFLLILNAAFANTFTATAYTKSCRGCSGITATGIPADAWGPVKIMAIDPNVLDLGACYILQFEDGHRSLYLAADTGSQIRGRKVDLLLKSESSAKKFGRQKVRVVKKTKCPKH